MDQSVYRLLTLNRNAMISAFKRLKRLKGLECIITKPQPDNMPYTQYEPGKRGSIFGMEDLVEYNHTEEYKDTLLIFNLFKEGYAGYNDFDTFTSDTYVLTLFEDKLPITTLIKVNFYGKHMNFKVDDHKTLAPSVSEQYFIKNILVPAT